MGGGVYCADEVDIGWCSATQNGDGAAGYGSVSDKWGAPSASSWILYADAACCRSVDSCAYWPGEYLIVFILNCRFLINVRRLFCSCRRHLTTF